MTKQQACDIISKHYGGIAQLARAIGSYPIGRGFKSNSRYGPLVKRLRHRPFTAVTWVRFPYGSPKNTAEKDTFSAVFFYPSRRLGISSPHEVWWISSALWAVYHQRRCIPLRLDDIQNFVLMICNFCEIDDIQGSRLDFNVRM